MFTLSKISPARFRSGTDLFYEDQNNLCSTKSFEFCQIVEASDRTLFEICNTGISQFFLDGDSGTFDDNINNISGDAVTSIVKSSLFARTGSSSARVTPDGTGGVLLRGDTNIVLKSGNKYKITGYLLTVASVSSALDITVQVGTEGWGDATLTQIQTWTAANNPTGLVFHKIEADLFVRAAINGKVTFNITGIDLASMPIHHFDDVTLTDEFRAQLQVRDSDDNVIFIDSDNSTFTLSADLSKILVDFPWTNVAVNNCYKFCIMKLDDFDNLVLNGDFIDTSIWNLTGASKWTIGGGVINYLGGGLPSTNADRTFDQVIILEAGKTYTLSFEITNYVAGAVQVIFDGVTIIIANANGTHTATITPLVAGGLLEFRGSSADNGDFDLDNVSVLLDDEFKLCAFVSECYDLRTKWDCSMLLSWENDTDYCDFDYETFQNGYGQNAFKNFLRVFSKLENPRYPKDKTIHLLSDGRTLLLHSKTEKIYEFFVDLMPEYLHDALSVGLEHDTFKIEESFIPQQEDEYINIEQDYEPDWADDLRVGTVRVNLKKKTPDCNRENNNC